MPRKTTTQVAKNTDEPEIESSGQNVRAVTRAVQVLKSFAGKRSQSLTEVATSTGLDKGTARRLLLTLMREDFVNQELGSQQYRLGFAMRELASEVQDEQDLRAIATPILSEFVRDGALTCFLSVYVEGQAICLERFHDVNGLEVRWWAVGGTMPYNVGGAPKLLLALQDETEIDRVLRETPPQPVNNRAVTEIATLRENLRQIRKDEYVLALDDVVLGIAALAVPVFSRSGNLACAISIAGTTPNLVHRKRPVHLERLRAAAYSIGRQIR